METGNEDHFTPRDKIDNKAAKWNPGCKASRAVGRPRKRWEDDKNQFQKPKRLQVDGKRFKKTTSNLQSLNKDNPSAIQYHDYTDARKNPSDPEMASGSSQQEAEVTHLKSTLATDVTKLDVR